jgi:hypothetical protein
MANFLPTMPMQTVPAVTANTSIGLFQANTGAPLPGPGAGPSASVAAINPLQATSLLSNPGTITPFDPFNVQVGIPPERSSSLNTAFAYPSDFGETFENTTNQVGESDLSDRRTNMTYLIGNSRDFGEPHKGSMMFLHVRPSQPYVTGRGKRIQTQEVYSLQQLNYILAQKSVEADASADMDIEGQSLIETAAAQYSFIGFYESYQKLDRGQLKAAVITNSGSYDEIPPVWPGFVRKCDHLGLILSYVDASEVVGGKYVFAEGKEKIIPDNADQILQIRPVNFGASKVFEATDSYDSSGTFVAGMQLCVGMAKNDIRNPKAHTDGSFYRVGTEYDHERHEIIFDCGQFEY